MAAEIYAAPDTAQRRTARRLAMVLACELHTLNLTRELIARSLFVSQPPPAKHARGLIVLAKLDTRRRVLRELLADQLEATA